MSRGFARHCPAIYVGLALICTQVAAVAQVQAASPGIVVDDSQAVLKGSWKNSTSVRPYVGEGYIHDENTAKGSKSAEFTIKVPRDGEYHVLLAYTPGPNRARRVPIEVHGADEVKTLHVDQTATPGLAGSFHPLGVFRFPGDTSAKVVISNKDTQNYVIVDAVALLTPGEFELARKDAKQLLVAKKPPAKKAPPPQAKPPEFKKTPPTRSVARLSPQQLDQLLAEGIGEISDDQLVADDHFLRRASLDLLGRPPTRDELLAFETASSTSKRADAIERMLAMPEYGANWANYWSDVIGCRQQEPELTFHDYRPFKKWLAQQLNSGTTWDEVVFRMLTAVGKVGDRPEATYIGFHQGNGHRLAGETSRIFLAVKIACAECHDHPFFDMPQEVFHGMAAFFARTEAKVAQFDSNDIEVKSKTKGEQRIPGQKADMQPTAPGGDSLELGMSDLDRRAALAYWITRGDNSHFARAYVNRIWSRLMGRGFSDPVDELSEDATVALPEVLSAIADSFAASGYDHRNVFRLIMNTRAYQRALSPAVQVDSQAPPAAVRAKRLRGDEVFASLVNAVELANVTPPREKKSGDVRFPPPPQSTRDVVNEVFGYDPSFRDRQILPTMKQAMFMMNHPQLQEQVSASGETFLARLLQEESQNEPAVTRLYQHVLARQPNANELKIAQRHIDRLQDRPTAFEDLLWCLINTAEFTTKN